MFSSFQRELRAAPHRSGEERRSVGPRRGLNRSWALGFGPGGLRALFYRIDRLIPAPFWCTSVEFFATTGFFTGQDSLQLAAGSRRNSLLTTLLVTLSRWTYAQKTSRRRAMAQSRSNTREALRTSARSVRSSYSSTRCLPSGRGMFCPTCRSRTSLGRLCLTRLRVGPIYSRRCRPRQPSSTPVAVAGGERWRSRGSCSRQARLPAISSAGRTTRHHRSDSRFRPALRRCEAMRRRGRKLRAAPDRPPVMSLSDKAREEVTDRPARQVRPANTEPSGLPPRRMCSEFRQRSMLGA